MDKKSTDTKGQLVERWRSATRPTLEELHRLIRQSDLSQREVERRAGFSSGYLTQLLSSKRDLKLWQVLAVLSAIGQSPADFFRHLYPDRRFPALAQFRKASSPLSEETDEILDRLYGSGVESLNQLRDRLSRCERAVAELELLGLVGASKEGS